MSSALLEELIGPSLEQKKPSPRVNLSFGEIGVGYRPGRTFGFSLIIHQFALLLLVVSGRFAFVHAAEAVPQHFEPMHVENLVYLPDVGGGSEGIGAVGGGAGSEQQASSGLRARSRQGFAYPGDRPKISDPPNATLGMQTILQPALKNPPLLHRYIPLPEIVQAPPVVAQEAPKPVMKVRAGRMAIRPVDNPMQAPKLRVPTATSSDLSNLTTAEMVMPQAPPPKPVSAPAEISDAPVDRPAQQGLLVLNAVPPPPDVSKVPMAEQRSLFAVAPGDTTVIADPAIGSKGGGTDAMAAGTGNRADIASGDAVADVAAGGGTGKGSAGSGNGSGGRYGNANGRGVNAAGEGLGSGRGTATGAGTGSSTGTVLGSGAGAGSAPGSGAFPGITVHGGRYGNAAPASLRPTLTPRRQTSYQMTITSTAASGGGLPDFGVFKDEKVYTVYLDMRATDEDTAQPWTLQYAVQQPADPAARIHGTPTPPYALLKQIPELTPDQVARSARKLIVVSGIMTADGKLEQLSVKQTPDVQLNDLVTEALSNWSFQPSQVEGKPVPLKFMLGIRLTAH